VKVGGGGGGVLVWGHRQCKCRTILGERRGQAVPISPFDCRMAIKQMAVIHEPPPQYPLCALPWAGRALPCPGGGRGGGVPDPPPKPEESTEVRCTPSANMRESASIES
jgi:hypothetical protein